MSGHADHVRQLIEVTSRLVAVLGRETEMLRRMRAQDIDELLSEKEALTAVYKRLMEDLRKQPEAMQRLASPLKAELRRAAQRLSDVSAENERMLAAALEANRRLFEIVAEAVRARQGVNSGYKATGRRGAVKRDGPADAVSLDQTL